MSREAMKMALDFISRLKFADAEPEPEQVMETIKKALDRIDAAPVAKNESGRITWLVDDWPKNCLLYTTPPPRKPLSDEEIDAATQAWAGHSLVSLDRLIMCREYARAIEAAHGIG